MRRGVGHNRRRHPQCPECGYNLVAAVAASRCGVVCPECGAALEPHELILTPAPGDWTPARGLRAAASRLSLRGITVALAFGGFVLTMQLAADAVGRNWTGIAIVLIGAMLSTVIAGFLVGRAMASGLAERAGFDGGVLTMMAIVFAWCAIFGGALLSLLVMPITIASASVIAAMAAVAAAVPIVRITLLEE